MEMKVLFPGGKRVDAEYHGFTIHTGQPVSEGGDGSAPTPFDLLLASLGTCSGFFVSSFCQNRSLPTDNIQLILRVVSDEKTHLMKTVDIDIVLPPEFPERYRAAVVRAAEMCLVKQTFLNPPVVTYRAII
ncbi:OsmC family protein [Desulfosarcina sp. OttesenSCG-928-G10]|nr:OsmC family protein [Desulfosarcina sp. OttesenSCG-928-G10]